MFIQLDFESDIPIYKQLKNEIMIGIAKQALHPGERLPSVRTMASDLGINLHTVNKAYQQLQQDGFLLIHRQRGVAVNPEGPPKADKLYKRHLIETMRPIIADSVCRQLTKEDLMAIIEDIYEDLEEGELDV